MAATTAFAHPADETGERKPLMGKQISRIIPIKEDIELVVAHLEAIENYFTDAQEAVLREMSNEISEAMESDGLGGIFLKDGLNVPFKVVSKNAVDFLRSGTAPLHEVRRMARLIRKGTTGLHANQIKTLVRSMVTMSLQLAMPGIVLGPMQSGKTGTAMAHAVFLAPLMYRLAGIRFYPMFLSTHLDVHRKQTEQEFSDALCLYGNLRLEVSTGIITPSDYYNMVNVFQNMAHRHEFCGNLHTDDGDADFEEQPTPLNYQESIMRGELDSIYEPIQIVFNRRRGPSVANIRQKAADATAKGFSLLLLIDEPQHGASGEVKLTGRKDRNDRDEYSGCVIRQIIEDVKMDLMKAEGHHMAIGFSATPFDTINMEGFWSVRASLSKNYVGYNCWGGKPIDPTVWFRTPELRNFGEIARATGNEDVENIKKLLADGDVALAQKAFYAMTDYLIAERATVAADVIGLRPELADRVNGMLANVGGFCIRFVNNNWESDSIIDMLDLESNFQVLRYYDDKESMTASEIIEAHYNKNDPRPPMLVVTGKARMGDNISRVIEMFIDFSNAKGDLNSLLQGLNGRACGESKFLSQVVLGEKPCKVMREYIETMGLPVSKPSQHADIIEGSVARGRGAKIMRVGLIGEGKNDPVIQRFIAAVNENIVRKRFGERKLTSLRTKESTRYDMLSIMRSITDEQGRNVYEYLSDPAVQARLFPQYERMEIVNPFNGETIKHTTKAKVSKKTGAVIPSKTYNMGYDITESGMNVSFRHRPTTELNSGHWGASDRDARRTDRASKFGENGVGNLEVQINCMLVDDAGNEILGDDAGSPQAYLVTFPLRKETAGKVVIIGEPRTMGRENGWGSAALTDYEVEAVREVRRIKAERSAKRGAKKVVAPAPARKARTKKPEMV